MSEGVVMVLSLLELAERSETQRCIRPGFDGGDSLVAAMVVAVVVSPDKDSTLGGSNKPTKKSQA